MATQPIDSPVLTIGEVAAATGLHTSAIRYYEDVRLLPLPQRAGGKRRYDPETIDRLLLIRFSRRLGFRISDLRGLLRDPRGARSKDVWRRLVDARLDEVAALIRAAKGVERVLRESRDCDCVTLASCRFLWEERSKIGQPAEAAIAGVRRHSRSQATRSAAGRAGLT
jgi:MerR family transcriptional regulator, redox-sensitive transcriptional activator SoxR